MRFLLGEGLPEGLDSSLGYRVRVLHFFMAHWGDSNQGVDVPSATSGADSILDAIEVIAFKVVRTCATSSF